MNRATITGFFLPVNMKNEVSQSESNMFLYVVLGLIVLVVGVIAFMRTRTPSVDSRAPALAQCLTQKGYKFYGASWCTHCAQQKAWFGDAAAALPYIECFDSGANEQNKTCKDAKINGYPTWITPDNQHIEGEQTVEQLIQLSGCKV